MTLRRLNGDRKRGWPIANAAISTTRKISGAKRARSPNQSVLDCGVWAMRVTSAILLRHLRRLRLQRHHPHQKLLVGIVAVYLAGHAAFPHDNDTMADRQDFGKFRRYRDDGNAFARHLAKEVVHFDLGADV